NNSSAVGGDGTGWLVAFNPENGEELWRTEAGSDAYASFKYSPILGDLNGDGGQEVVLMNGNSIRIFDGVTGALLTCSGSVCSGGNARLRIDSAGRNTPVIADIDGDGDLELVAASGSEVYIWHEFEDLEGATPGTNSAFTSHWPMWRGNAQRTGSTDPERLSE
ncbi:MAG: VCBS repeat-containing protein, partial [Bdellovibrionales bacterium]|nr:VCBS repeat-containing protein [Bdellovibrionales bacterium]